MQKQLVLKQFDIYMQRVHMESKSDSKREEENNKKERQKEKRKEKPHLTYKNKLKMDQYLM